MNKICEHLQDANPVETIVENVEDIWMEWGEGKLFELGVTETYHMLSVSERSHTVK